MIGKPGPFQIVECEGTCSSDHPVDPPRRRYSCPHYETCLNLAAALNWDSYTCRGCCGEIDESLYWRARQIMKRDSVVRTLCNDLPEIKMHNQDGVETTELPEIQIVGER